MKATKKSTMYRQGNGWIISSWDRENHSSQVSPRCTQRREILWAISGDTQGVDTHTRSWHSVVRRAYRST